MQRGASRHLHVMQGAAGSFRLFFGHQGAKAFNNHQSIGVIAGALKEKAILVIEYGQALCALSNACHSRAALEAKLLQFTGVR